MPFIFDMPPNNGATGKDEKYEAVTDGGVTDRGERD